VLSHFLSVGLVAEFGLVMMIWVMSGFGLIAGLEQVGGFRRIDESMLDLGSGGTAVVGVSIVDVNQRTLAGWRNAGLLSWLGSIAVVGVIEQRTFADSVSAWSLARSGGMVPITFFSLGNNLIDQLENPPLVIIKHELASTLSSPGIDAYPPNLIHHGPDGGHGLDSTQHRVFALRELMLSPVHDFQDALEISIIRLALEPLSNGLGR
jgi:hypothetical protein